MASLGLALAVALTTTLTGHAADWGDLTLSAGIDWVHVVATTAWTGGLIALALAVLRKRASGRSGVLGGCMRRFSRLAGFCVTAVLATGLYNAWVQLPGPAALVTTIYGRALAVKLLLVLGLLWWGAVNRYTVVPALDRDRPADPDERRVHLARWLFRESSRGSRAAPSHLSAFVAREAVLAILVFACTAVLVDSTPPRHVEHWRTSSGQLRVPLVLGSRRHDRVLRRAPQPVFDPERGQGLGIRAARGSESCLLLKRAQGRGRPEPMIPSIAPRLMAASARRSGSSPSRGSCT